ncbi:MAG: glycosyltransferase [Desulforegulaceae bacterium]|nr:glycosyltransferase [Desulforegulaceae bacterium]
MNYKDKKILIIIPSFQKGGGAEKIAIILGNELSKNYELAYLTFYNSDSEHESYFKRFSLNEKPGKVFCSKLIYALKRIRFIKRIEREYHPDLIISFMFDANFFTMLSVQYPKKVILSVHSDIYRFGYMKRKILAFLYRRAAYTHAITKKMELNLKENKINKTIVIYNTHDIKHYQQLSLSNSEITIPKEKFVFLNIARLNYAKGQWHLLKSFSLVAKNYPNAFLIILGEGVLRNQLERLSDDLCIRKKVLMAGNVDNVFPVIKKADCFVFPSLYEGLPNVLIEALAVGTKIVSTDCISGPREIIAPELDISAKVSYPYQNEQGVLVEPFRKEKMDFSKNISTIEKKLASVMMDFMKDKPVNEKYAFDVERFSIDSTVREWDKLAKGIIYD